MPVLFIELFLLGIVNNIIWRGNTATDIANYAGIKPKCFERPNLHIKISYFVPYVSYFLP